MLEIAEGGTVFLDEIGEMGAAMQVKLLRFLEEKTFRRVGGTRDIRVNVRIIAATNRNLEQAVSEGHFREDLFYRLRVIPIRLPSLSERHEDIPILVQYFVDRFNQEFRKRTAGVTPEALSLFTGYAWPGNVRELRNVIERIMILEDKDLIDVEDLPRAMRSGVETQAVKPALEMGGMTLSQLEQCAISRALEQAGQNQVQAAKLLGISRDTLRYRMKKFGLLKENSD